MRRNNFVLVCISVFFFRFPKKKYFCQGDWNREQEMLEDRDFLFLFV